MKDRKLRKILKDMDIIRGEETRSGGAAPFYEPMYRGIQEDKSARKDLRDLQKKVDALMKHLNLEAK